MSAPIRLEAGEFVDRVVQNAAASPPASVSRTMPGGRVAASTLARGPNGLPLCRWCDLDILARRRRTFCSDYCVDQWRLRTDPGYVRDRVFARDGGVCAACGADTVRIFAALKRSRGPAREAGLRFYGMKSITSRRSLWDADHIRPVAEGGGQCDLDNLRTLCVSCHREATAALRQRLARRLSSIDAGSQALCEDDDHSRPDTLEPRFRKLIPQRW